VRLSETVAALGRDHVQLRINRPDSTDYNPPHRDGSLPIWANALNVWIPVAGVDELTSLPIAPGSHRVAEEACWQTEAGGVAIRGRQYRVPAIARLRRGPLDMIRTTVAFGQALLFTPFLIHGLAVNQSNRTRMALELRLDVVSH
jgi:ectoine hydroxylase-related dioxygenase (phytanoyl-CoA dioxygenase family)